MHDTPTVYYKFIKETELMETDRCVSQLYKDCLRLADYLGNQVSYHCVRISAVPHYNKKLTGAQGLCRKEIALS